MSSGRPPKSWTPTRGASAGEGSRLTVLRSPRARPAAETISVKTSPAPSSSAIVRKERLVTPAIGARKNGFGSSTPQKVNAMGRRQ